MHIQGSCYKISSRTVNWNAAKSACEALGSKLAMVKSQAEQQALAPRISHRTWIGLHRDPKDKSRWLWLDGTRPIYTRWSRGEPNNIREECGEFFKKTDGWSWNDKECSSNLRYVCETNGKQENIMQKIDILLILSQLTSV